jgi:hypothetical protein
MFRRYSCQRREELQMTTGTRAVEVSADIFEVARRTASLDNVDVSTLLESLVRRHAEDIDTFEDLSAGMPRFSLKHYKPQRDPGETDEEFEARVSLFR